MNKLHRIVNNTVISLVGQAVTWTSTLLLTIAYGRFLGDVKFGELYFAISLVALIGFPIEFGFNLQLVRDVAQEQDDARRYLSNTVIIKFSLWLILYCCIFLFCWLIGYSPEIRMLVTICGITLLFTGITNIFSSLHYAIERNIFPVIGTILEKGLTALLGFFLLKYGAGVLVIAFVLMGGSCTNLCWQALWFVRSYGFQFTIDPYLIRKLMHTSIPFMLYGILGVIYYRLDTILLSFMTNTATVGWYGAGYRIFDTLTFLPGIVIGAIMYPVFSKLSFHSEETLKTAVEKSTNFLLLSVFPITTLMVLAAPNIVGYLYHRSDFEQTVYVLQGLGPGLIFLYVNSILSAILMSTKREKKMPILAGIALIFNLSLNLFLIPRYQHVGAAVVTSLTEMLLLVLSLFFIPRYLIPVKSIPVCFKSIIASAGMGGIIWLLRTHSIFIIMLAAIPVYFMLATLLRTIPGEDLRSIYQAMRSKTQKQSTSSHDQLMEEPVLVQ